MRKIKKGHHCFAVEKENNAHPGPEHIIRHKLMHLRLLIDAIESNLK